MKQFVILSVLLVFSLPVGFSIAGCAGTNPNNYCNKTGHGYGLKTNQVAAINLPGNTIGISLAFGQTGQLQSPTATNCNGGSESVAIYNYGSTNLNLVDVTPNGGALCGGTWNRHSPGGIPDFTVCTAPTPAAIAAGCTGTAPAVTCLVQMTASGDGVTSNTVPVWVHPAVTTIQLSVASPTGVSGFQGCFSQNQTSQLDAIAFVSSSSTIPFCAPPGNAFNVPDCTVNLGHFTYTPVNAGVVTIDQNGVATAHQPGSSAITAAISSVSSTAGTFSTCPPATIQLQIPSTIPSTGNGTIGTVTPGTPVPLTTTILDTNNNPITGLLLDYSSTNPLEISVGSGGSVSTTFPSTAAITAVCNPPSCNPSLITQIGQLGNGLPIASNSVRITSTGRSSTYLWMASPQSGFFEPVDLTTGTIGSPIKLPYIPNSMVLDQGGNNLYFGNYRELMTFNAVTNSLTKEDTSVPGVVLAVSPDASTAVIADQVRQVIYLYTVSTGTHTSIGGLATRAQFSPDGKTLYLTGPSPSAADPSAAPVTLYVHNTNSGWSVFNGQVNQTTPPENPVVDVSACTLNNNNYVSSTTPYTPFCTPDLAVTIPAEGAFVSGSATSAYSFCPDTTTTPFVYYPSALSPETTLPETDHLTATTDRVHILGANPTTLTDLYLGSIIDGVASPGVPVSNGLDNPNGGTCDRPLPGVNTSAGLTFPLLAPLSQTLAPNPNILPVAPASIDQVVASPDSTIAFVTYTAPSGTVSPILPAYTISSTFGQAGTLSAVKLSGTATAPLAGIFSPDNTIFFVGTAGDNLVHFIDVPTLTDTKTINPGLVDPTGAPVPVQFLAAKPRPTT
jgi:trimeric autotransporter adhesin